MARPTSNYSPENCNYGGFEILPEGEHLMEITAAFVKSGQKGLQWEIELQPVATQYRSKYPVKCWLNEEWAVNAIYDAAGADPKQVADREYTPDEFVGKKIMVNIYHQKGKEEGKVYCRVRRLCAVFSRGGKPVSENNGQEVPF